MADLRSATLLLILGAVPATALVVACGADEGGSSDPMVTPDGAVDGSVPSKDASSSTDSSAKTDSALGSFTVGGQVTGLTSPDGGLPDAGDAGARTLKLRENGAGDLTVSSNGPFTFAKSVASGSPYAVTVETQPTGHSCTVSSGDGTIANANVTNVGVACARDQLTISADVKGLTRAGLVLQNNLGGDITVNATSKVPFGPKVLYGDPYSVTVKTQPAALPRQKCTVDAGSGVATGNVEVVVNCADDFLSAAAYDADATFTTDASGIAVIGLAWDGTAYFEASANAPANPLVRYDAAFAFVQAYPLARNVRSIFGIGAQLYIRSGGSAAIEKVDAVGVVTAGVTVTPAPICGDCPVVYEKVGDQLVANAAGTLLRWKLVDGTALASTPLVGFGLPGETSFYYGQWIAAASGYVLSFAQGGVLSAWDPTTGVRVRSATLSGADPTMTTEGVTLSYANGRVWVRDAYSGVTTWRGYDIGL